VDHDGSLDAHDADIEVDVSSLQSEDLVSARLQQCGQAEGEFPDRRVGGKLSR
jgi:hypothetical protein